jgi:hypothetical protein
MKELMEVEIKLNCQKLKMSGREDWYSIPASFFKKQNNN